MMHVLRVRSSVITSLLREVAAFYRFFWRTPAIDKTIVIYAEHEGYYVSFEWLVEKLTGEHQQTVSYVTSDPDDPILQTTKARIKAFYLNKLLPFFMCCVNCRVFVMTLPDLGQFHLKRSINSVHYVYVFHSLVSTHMAYRDGAFDNYDSILCVGPHQVEEFHVQERRSGRRRKKLVEAGYHRLERIYGAYQRYESQKPLSGNRGTVLIAPSWGAANILESCGERLVEIVLAAGYEVVVRPHPETVRRAPELLAVFASRFGNQPNFTLERSVATDDSLLRADVLICDCSGVALEYAFGTERPVLFLDVPLKINNPRFKELGIEPLELSLRSEIGVIVSPEQLDSVPEAISRLMTDSSVYKKRLAQLRGKYVFNFGRSSEIGAQYIMDLCRN
ncbi:MAG: CDP-glycerol glycerophosphotransferase family protein [Candidatus Omnitrophica bacterium]|nr:CDP-glycerol glycerophosphotransferase family protein [Candidatus Omnitrophota bacterium]